jgi:hypothetical protein
LTVINFRLLHYFKITLSIKLLVVMFSWIFVIIIVLIYLILLCRISYGRIYDCFTLCLFLSHIFLIPLRLSFLISLSLSMLILILFRLLMLLFLYIFLFLEISIILILELNYLCQLFLVFHMIICLSRWKICDNLLSINFRFRKFFIA